MRKYNVFDLILTINSIDDLVHSSLILLMAWMSWDLFWRDLFFTNYLAIRKSLFEQLSTKRPRICLKKLCQRRIKIGTSQSAVPAYYLDFQNVCHTSKRHKSECKNPPECFADLMTVLFSISSASFPVKKKAKSRSAKIFRRHCLFSQDLRDFAFQHMCKFSSQQEDTSQDIDRSADISSMCDRATRLWMMSVHGRPYMLWSQEGTTEQ